MNGKLLVAAAVWALAAHPALAAPAVITSVEAKLAATPAMATGACPQTVTFEGLVVIHGQFPPGKAAEFGVRFKRSDGAIAPISYFSVGRRGGKQAVTATWVLGGNLIPAYAGWERIKVWPTAGHHAAVFSNKANFTMRCHVRRPAHDRDR